MHKKHLLALLFFVFMLGAKAQLVTIPDANFVAYLQANFPSCMHGNKMDTTCIASVQFVSCVGRNISNLDGIQYFDNLLELYCFKNNSVLND